MYNHSCNPQWYDIWQLRASPISPCPSFAARTRLARSGRPIGLHGFAGGIERHLRPCGCDGPRERGRREEGSAMPDAAQTAGACRYEVSIKCP